MSEFKNDERFKIAGDKKMTVSVVLNVAVDSSMETVLRNAAEALKRQADLGNMHVWVDKITVSDA